MKWHFNTLVIVIACIAMVLCVSCKKSHNEPTADGTAVYGSNNGIIEDHEYVDLGLPSGTLWATCNVGAYKPEDYGEYFAWGETTVKTTYNWSLYRWFNESSNVFTKYNTQSNYGTVDDKTILDPADDAACMKWGKSWRMPTCEEMKELKDECTWTWTVKGEKSGYSITGPNGKSIFLPAAGYRFGEVLNSTDSHGFYWSSSLYSPIPNNAYSIYFHSDNVNPQGVYPRFRGYTVRPVWNNKK